MRIIEKDLCDLSYLVKNAEQSRIRSLIPFVFHSVYVYQKESLRRLNPACIDTWQGKSDTKEEECGKIENNIKRHQARNDEIRRRSRIVT